MIRERITECYLDTNGSLNKGQNQDALKNMQIRLCIEQKNLLMLQNHDWKLNVKKHALLPLSIIQKSIAHITSINNVIASLRSYMYDRNEN